jgi:predicted nucleic acid-binding protein
VKEVLIDTCVYLDWLNQGRHEEVMSSLSNDVLIALTARASGAAVVTANLDDFAAIQRIERFDLMPP